MLPLRMLGLLMLMLSLCDADSICPTELTLDVPRVIEKYGASVEVNCTSTEADHKGMYWRIGNNDSRVILGESFISQSVSLSEWNVTAECRILLNETHECSKELEITIYQNPTVAVFPVNRAVEGTLFELQCNITDVAPVQNLVVRWFKDNQTIRTDNFTNTTTTPVSEYSTLAVNISRAEHGAEFRCEAELDFGSHGPQLPVHSDIHIVSVNYAPEFKNTSEDFFVHEGDDVTLNCDAEGRPQPTFHWKHDGKKLSDTNNLNITRVNTKTPDIVSVSALDSGPVMEGTEIQLKFAPEINEGTYSKVVNLDGNVTLDCSAEGNPLPVLHWNYTTAENVRETTRGHQKSLTITGATSTNAGFYICVAMNNVGEVTSTVTLKMKGIIIDYVQ
ncbi:hypothetical protein JOQ06_014277 [Pogonophryne albipinna]|uniref:Ig-like domain-containing protein n=1 Tax=Pogonophryne albipinna TaxID=1090488 RepID=A0AAD6F469_9TELE|nr:hypothetical protein JOQ06_014277 [Pogonophryne albipinna]